jgi:hypothetical protein
VRPGAHLRAVPSPTPPACRAPAGSAPQPAERSPMSGSVSKWLPPLKQAQTPRSSDSGVFPVARDGNLLAAPPRKPAHRDDVVAEMPAKAKIPA